MRSNNIQRLKIPASAIALTAEIAKHKKKKPMYFKRYADAPDLPGYVGLSKYMKRNKVTKNGMVPNMVFTIIRTICPAVIDLLPLP